MLGKILRRLKAKPANTSSSSTGTSTHSEDSKRISLGDIELSQSTIDLIHAASQEKVINMTMLASTGLPAGNIIQTDLAMLEIKVSALLILLDKHGFDFATFNRMMAVEASSEIKTALDMRPSIDAKIKDQREKNNKDQSPPPRSIGIGGHGFHKGKR